MYGNSVRGYDAGVAVKSHEGGGRFSRVDKQIETLRQVAAEIEGISANLADKLFGGTPTSVDGRSEQEKLPPSGMISERLDGLYHTLTRVKENLARIDGEQ